MEQETGLSKDVLRVWERRYGFPLPLRAAGGERLYPEEQLAKLKLVRRLMDAGMRPGRILALPLEHLMELARGGEGEPEPATAEHEVALELLRAHRGAELRNALQHAILRDGLFRFLTDMAGPLAVRVGEAWMRGEIRVFEEHLFTEQLTAPPASASIPMPHTAETKIAQCHGGKCDQSSANNAFTGVQTPSTLLSLLHRTGSTCRTKSTAIESSEMPTKSSF